MKVSDVMTSQQDVNKLIDAVGELKGQQYASYMRLFYNVKMLSLGQQLGAVSSNELLRLLAMSATRWFVEDRQKVHGESKDQALNLADEITEDMIQMFVALGVDDEQSIAELKAKSAH